MIKIALPPLSMSNGGDEWLWMYINNSEKSYLFGMSAYKLIFKSVGLPLVDELNIGLDWL